MKMSIQVHRPKSLRPKPQRGSVLIAALVFSLIIVIALASYLKLAGTSSTLSHRTFFADAAANLAETGLEEAVWSFNSMGNWTTATNPTTVLNAWNGTAAGAGGTTWTIGNKVANVYIEDTGSGYSSAPSVSFSSPGGSGTTATGTAVLSTRYVSSAGSLVAITGVGSVTVTNPGSGYTSAPTITISGGGGSGAAAQARLAATHTFTFTGLDQNATGKVNVWVDGYDGTAVVPVVVAKAIIIPPQGRPVEKYVEIILSKNSSQSKGVVADQGINFNGHPTADSFASSVTAGYPPFKQYLDPGVAVTSNTTIASLSGTIALSQGTIDGSVLTGPTATVSGNGNGNGNGNSGYTITGSTIPNFAYTFGLPTYPSYTGDPGQYQLGTAASLPTALPRPAVTVAGVTTPADSPAADGKYYYFTSGTTIANCTVAAGANVVIVGSGNSSMATGFNITSTVAGVQCGTVTVYMDGGITLNGNDEINNTTWAGALKVYTSYTGTISFSGNAKFCGVLTAPYAALTCNGSGNDMADLAGSFIVKSVTDNGHMNFHWDSNLASLTSPKAWSLTLWRELQTQQDRALYSTQLNF